MGIFDKFKLGFKKTATTFTSGLKDINVKIHIYSIQVKIILRFVLSQAFDHHER